MSEESQGDITVLTKANTRSQSLRTTIPMSITRQLRLKEGGKLRWEIQAKDNNLVVVVSALAHNES
ncbi:AbrB family transcriptional regulator [Nitrososphaera viennensis]|nr:AbrB family transcriptional regulator [Nitrososphaera viennensis]UVS68335.1 AbrB family transcriptional regulator [Nitrososphaera viennensis]